MICFSCWLQTQQKQPIDFCFSRSRHIIRANSNSNNIIYLQHEQLIAPKKSSGPLPHHRRIRQRQAVPFSILAHRPHCTHRLLLQGLLIKPSHQGRITLLPNTHHQRSFIQRVHLPQVKGFGDQDEVSSHCGSMGCHRRRRRQLLAQVLRSNPTHRRQ